MMCDVCNGADDVGAAGDVVGNDDGGGDVGDGHGGEDTDRDAVGNAGYQYARAVAEVVFAEIDRIKTKLRLCEVAAIAFVRTRKGTDVRCSPLGVPPP